MSSVSSVPTEDATQAPVAKQPLHPSIIDLLDPEYIEFHNKHVVNITPPHTLPWSPAIRNGMAVPGGTPLLKVAKTQDFDLPTTKCRAFTPEGTPPAGGWPLFIFFHGGGWTLGNIDSENSFCTNMCVRAECVVITVDYRLAPENPYPAAVDDAIDALKWAAENAPRELGTNPAKVAVGGSSSGGNLATILALKALELTPPLPVMFQLLIVPVTDNTASVATSWRDREHAPWLSPGRMEWFKAFYLPDSRDWTRWDASPLFASDALVAQLPPAWLGLAELDILCPEGVSYAEKLRAAGVPVEMEVYKGAPHPIMAMDGGTRDRTAGVLNIGKKLVGDAAAALRKAFYGQEV